MRLQDDGGTVKVLNAIRRCEGVPDKKGMTEDCVVVGLTDARLTVEETRLLFSLGMHFCAMKPLKIKYIHLILESCHCRTIVLERLLYIHDRLKHEVHKSGHGKRPLGGWKTYEDMLCGRCAREKSVANVSFFGWRTGRLKDQNHRPLIPIVAGKPSGLRTDKGHRDTDPLVANVLPVATPRWWSPRGFWSRPTGAGQEREREGVRPTLTSGFVGWMASAIPSTVAVTGICGRHSAVEALHEG